MRNSRSQCWHAGSCDSTITYIDGKKGVLLYRGQATASGLPNWQTTTFTFTTAASHHSKTLFRCNNGAITVQRKISCISV